MEDDLYNFESVYKDVDSIFGANFEKPNEKCNEIYIGHKRQYTEIDSSFITNCNKSAAYIKYLEDAYKGNINTAKGIIYVYCWLCDVEFNNPQYKNSGINIYKKLLHEYTDIVNDSNIPYIFESFLKDNIDENLKNLYDLYYKFHKFKKKQICGDNSCKCLEECYKSYNNYINVCNNSANVDFCYGLEEFRAQYNNYMSDNSECNGDYKYLPSAINSGISVILIPTIATLIITSILFVLYKFTPLGSWICPRSKNKYKMKNNIGEGMYNRIHRSGITNIGLNKNPYTIAYHSMEHS